MKRLFLLLALLIAAPAWAQDDSPKVQARLVAEDKAAQPGGSITIALKSSSRPNGIPIGKIRAMPALPP